MFDYSCLVRIQAFDHEALRFTEFHALRLSGGRGGLFHSSASGFQRASLGTYLYLPVAFTMLLVARILPGSAEFSCGNRLRRGCFAAGAFACATWGRSQRVCRSADIAQRILKNLPTGDWRQGEWYIRLANAPGFTLPQRYGLYTYRGLDTICIGDGMGAIQSALQVKSGNEHGLFAKALSAGEMAQSCRAGSALQDPCFWVYPDGRVEQYSGAAAAQPSALR